MREVMPGTLEMFKARRREVRKKLIQAGRDWAPTQYKKLDKEFQTLTHQIRVLEELKAA